METKNETLRAALSYASQGYSVVPISGNGDRKKPLVNWSALIESQATEEKIREWWGAFPDAGVAIVLGKVSGLIMVDLEGDAVDALDSMPPSDRSGQTGGGGMHLFYKYVDGALTQRFGNGVSLRSNGTYVVAPPSRHASGDLYEWTSNGEPSSVDLEDLISRCKAVNK